MARHNDTLEPTPAPIHPGVGAEPETDPTARTGWRAWRPSADGTTPILDQLLTEHDVHL